MGIRKRPSIIKGRKEGGFSLIEIGMTLIAIAISAAGLSLLMSNNANTLKAKAIAEKMRVVVAASHAYMTQNEGALTASLATGAYFAIPAGKTCSACAVPNPSLQQQGLLSSAFIDQNNARQRHALIIKKLANGKLEGLVTTFEGGTLEDSDIGYVSGLLGSFGGGVYNNAAVSPTNQIAGSAGGWGDATANWNTTISGVSVRPRSGTIQASLSMASDSGFNTIDPNDVLYRKDVGYPVRNTMETNLMLGNNDITGINQMQANSFMDRSGGNVVDPSGTSYFEFVDVDRTLDVEQTITSRGKIMASGATTDIEAGRDVIGNRYVEAINAFRMNGRDVINNGHDGDFDDVRVRNTHRVEGTTNLEGTVNLNTVGGNTTVNNTLTVHDGVSLNTVGGITNVGGGLTAERAVTMNATSGSTTILGSLSAHSGVTLNTTSGNTTIRGVTTVQSNFNVTGGSSTTLGGWLTVNDGATITGNVTMNSNLTVTNNVTAAAYYYGSDERLKDNIRDVDGWAVISKLKPKAYEFKRDGRKAMGFIAQDVEEHFPELVTEDEDGMKAVNYIDLIAPMIDEIQELRGEVDALKAAQTQPAQ